MISRSQAGLPPLPSLTRCSHEGVVLHCTGGSARPLEVAAGLARVRIIHTSHTRERGWAYAGYHYVVLPGGEVVELRGRGVRGAHAKGRNAWLGVALLGRGLDMTDAEKAAVLELAAGLPIIPHNAISKKSCPGPVPTAWVRGLG